MNKNKFVMIRSELHLELSRWLNLFVWFIHVGDVLVHEVYIYIRVCCHITLVAEWERMAEPLVISSNERKRNVPWQKLSWIFCTHERSQRMNERKRRRKIRRTNERMNSIANEWECSRNSIWQAKCLAVVVVCLFCCVYSVVARVVPMKSCTLFAFIRTICARVWVWVWVSAFSRSLSKYLFILNIVWFRDFVRFFCFSFFNAFENY